MKEKPKIIVKERSDIIARRLKHPFALPSIAIPLAEPERWELHVANTGASPGRIAEMVAKGWTFVAAGDIDGRIEDHGYEVRDGRIVRGARGEEVLMKMERDDFRQIQKAKAAQNIQSTFGTKAVKQAILDKAAAEPDGDQGASFLERSLRNIEIKDRLETIPADER